jgi:spermidine synthase
MRNAMRNAGFDDVHTLDFPQPVYPSGWWSATLATKGGNLKNFREQAVRDKPFKTRYYNYSMHKAAMEETPLLAEALS